MELNNLLLIFIIFNALIIFFFEKINFLKINIDQPDGKRKLHKKPIPLAGGLIIFSNIVIYFLLVIFEKKLLIDEIIFKSYVNIIVFFITTTIIFILGFFDDRYNISATRKFFILTIILIVALVLDKSINIKVINFSFIDQKFNLSEYSVLFTCFCFLVFLNAFNMFDGINLQSGSYSIIIFLSLLIFYSDSFFFKVMLISIICYTLLNLQNKIFLGDSGTLITSFVIGYIFISLYNLEVITFADEIVLYMLLPGIDLIRLFFKRLLSRKNPLSPDRFHIHHILLMKFSIKKTLIIMCSFVLLPIILNYFEFNRLFIIVFFVLIYVILLKALKISSHIT